MCMFSPSTLFIRYWTHPMRLRSTTRLKYRHHHRNHHRPHTDSTNLPFPTFPHLPTLPNPHRTRDNTISQSSHQQTNSKSSNIPQPINHLPPRFHSPQSLSPPNPSVHKSPSSIRSTVLTMVRKSNWDPVRRTLWLRMGQNASLVLIST